MGRIYEKQTIISIFALVSVVFYYFAIFYHGAGLNLLALFYLIVVILVLPSTIAQVWIFFLYFFGLVFAVVSNGMIEFLSSYLSEVGEHAEITGAAARNALLIAIFMCGVLLFFNAHGLLFKRTSRRLAVVDGLTIKVMVFLGFLLVIYMSYIVIRYGSPLTMGMDRFSYRKNVAPSGYGYVSSLVYVIGFAISYARETGRLRAKFSLGWLVFAMVLLVLGGEKFSGLLILLFFYCLPYFVVSEKSLSSRHFVFGAIFILFAAMLVLLNYYSIYGSRFLEMFETRLALQGQMLFSLDQVASVASPSKEDIIASFFGFGNATESGMSYLMYLVAPQEVVDRFLEGGATFTAPYPANISYFFGFYSAPIVVFILGGGVGALGGGLYKALRDQNFLFAILLLKMFFYVYISVVMGEVNMLVDWKMAVYLGAVLFFLMIQGVGSWENEREYRCAAGSI
ncbi:DUF6418 domain-containing protein [Halomonas sp. HK25]|uniref:DUF6418 domain-containing protein n=1 Tax=Halomonas sp. HK25 TaxID=3394321 RepID=UPI0039FD0491